MIIFCHGLESGPFGSKCSALSDAGLDVLSPDFRGMNIEQRANYLHSILYGFEEPVTVVGSSFGGAAALRAAKLIPYLVERLILLAPALRSHLWPIESPAAVPCEVIHGTEDETIPFEWSERFCGLHGYTLHALEDGHRLNEEASLKLLVEVVTS